VEPDKPAGDRRLPALRRVALPFHRVAVASYCRQIIAGELATTWDTNSYKLMVGAVALCEHEANAPAIASNHSPESTNFKLSPKLFSATAKSASLRLALSRSVHPSLSFV
jgi:hypothetical protein